MKPLSLILLLASVALFTSCGSTPKPIRPTAPVVVQKQKPTVEKTVKAVEKAETTNRQASDKVKQLEKNLDEAKKESSDLLKTIDKILVEGAAAGDAILKQAAEKARALQAQLVEANKRAEEAAKSQLETERAITQVSKEVSELKANLAAQNVILEQHELTNEALTENNIQLQKETRQAKDEASEAKGSVTFWRRLALWCGGILIVFIIILGIRAYRKFAIPI